MPSLASRSSVTGAAVALRLAIVALALGTAGVHATLGGLHFTFNALGYVTAAAAMVVPVELAVRYRWVVRLGLIGYAAATVVGWAVQGPYYSTAYIAKAIEILLIATLAIDFVRADGNPVTVLRGSLDELLGRLGSRRDRSGAPA